MSRQEQKKQKQKKSLNGKKVKCTHRLPPGQAGRPQTIPAYKCELLALHHPVHRRAQDVQAWGNEEKRLVYGRPLLLYPLQCW